MALPVMTQAEWQAITRGTPAEGRVMDTPLPPRGYSAETDAALDLLLTGAMPATQIRELDAWTGAVHYEDWSGGMGPTGNVNIWILDNGVWKWASQDGTLIPREQAERIPWIPAPPDTEAYASGEYIQPRSELEQLPPAQTTATIPSDLKSTDDVTQGGDTLFDQVKNAGIAAMGGNLASWDEWNWFYEQIVGQSGPAPEDRGLVRDGSGRVMIDGQERYSVETWWRKAFPNVPGPAPASGPDREGVSGVAGRAGGLLTALVAMITWLVRAVVAGYRAGSAGGA